MLIDLAHTGLTWSIWGTPDSSESGSWHNGLRTALPLTSHTLTFKSGFLTQWAEDRCKSQLCELPLAEARRCHDNRV